MKLEIGAVYENGFGCRVKIVRGPNAKNRWYEDEWGDHYHETGELVRLGSSTPEYNLCLLISHGGVGK